MGRYDSLFCLLGAAACIAVVVVAVRLEPDARGHGTHVQLGLDPCAYMLSTGKPCLSCGMTTSFAQMARLDPAAALKANPFGSALFLVVLLAPIWFLDSFRKRLPPFRFLEGRKVRIALPIAGLLLLVNWAWLTLRGDFR